MVRVFRQALGWGLLFSGGFIGLFSGVMAAQPALRLKTRGIRSPRGGPISEISSPVRNGKGHLILQFEQAPDAVITAALGTRQVTVLSDVPVNGLLVSLQGRASVVGLGVRYAERIDPVDKISPLLSSLPAPDPAGFYLVEFYADVNAADVRALVLNAGLELRDNPDLNPNQLLVYSPAASSTALSLAPLEALAANDEIAYIFPASADLVNGIPAAPCAGPLTVNGAMGQFIATNGAGWDGAGLSAVTLNYAFSQLTEKLPSATTQSEIQRAMAEWSKVIALTWQASTNPNGSRTVNILFASGAHGDAYPFDGPGGVLAHTFYPAPPNPEPIAGDMHFDDSESWHAGANIDVFSVALHELGHSLGLGHSDNPADVMYPYYKMVSTLAAGDKAAILTMYAAQTGTPASPGGGSPTTPAPTTPAPTTPTSPTTGTTSGTPTSGTPGSGTPGSGTPGSGTTNPGTSKDTTPPTLTIGSPATTSVTTSLSAITFSGTATDNVGVVKVSWTTNMGYSGTATGTTQWTASIPLIPGSNTVTISAADAAGNVGWRSVVVRR